MTVVRVADRGGLNAATLGRRRLARQALRVSDACMPAGVLWSPAGWAALGLKVVHMSAYRFGRGDGLDVRIVGPRARRAPGTAELVQGQGFSMHDHSTPGLLVLPLRLRWSLHTPLT